MDWREAGFKEGRLLGWDWREKERKAGSVSGKRESCLGREGEQPSDSIFLCFLNYFNKVFSLSCCLTAKKSCILTSVCLIR